MKLATWIPLLALLLTLPALAAHGRIVTDGNNPRSPLRIRSVLENHSSDYMVYGPARSAEMGAVSLSVTVTNSSPDQTLRHLVIHIAVVDGTGVTRWSWVRRLERLKPGATFHFQQSGLHDYAMAHLRPRVTAAYDAK